MRTCVPSWESISNSVTTADSVQRSFTAGSHPAWPLALSGQPNHTDGQNNHAGSDDDQFGSSRYAHAFLLVMMLIRSELRNASGRVECRAPR